MGSSGDMALYMSSHNERTPDPQRRIIIIIIKNGIYQVSALHRGTKRNVVNAFFHPSQAMSTPHRMSRIPITDRLGKQAGTAV